MSSFRGNKGEWSELYVFLKLLADRKLYGADSDTNILSEIYYDILSIYRYEKEGKYSYSPKGNDRICVSVGNEKIIEVPTSHFLKYAKVVLEEIKQHDKGRIQIPEVDEFAKRIHLKNLSAASNKKADIHIKTYDYRTRHTPELAFSIKSQLGSPATLFNASKKTNFRYLINNSLNQELINKFNKEKKFNNKFKLLEEYSINLEFDKVLSETFNNNLILIDSDLPNIIAIYLIKSFYLNEKKIKNLTPYISKENPLNIKHNNLELFYSYKWKEFLTSVALGLVPDTPWNGLYDATGGYIIVREDGNVVCYHIYNRNEFREYLYKNIKFENGSTKRHNFGKIYEHEGRHYLNLNLQLRFIN